MTNNNSLTSIDQLATETILEIFEYLSSNDIIYAFFDFNQRFNSILMHQPFRNYFKTPTANFYFWQNILQEIGSNIHHLIITSINSGFCLDLFPNLRSIVIASPLPIDHNQLYSITESIQFNKLISFKIQSRIHNNEFRTSLFENIFHQENSLQTFQCISPLYFTCLHVNKLMINKNISSLSLKLRNYTDAFSLLPYVPNLKYFNLIVSSIIIYDRFDDKFDLFKIKLEKFNFTCKTDGQKYQISETNFRSLTNFIKHFSSSLIYLSIDLSEGGFFQVYSFQFNGNFLEKQLLDSMIELKSFHFYVELSQPTADVENLLLTFKKQFWFDHHWSIGMHGNYIYTLPFHFHQLNGIIDFNHIQSNNLKILNSSQTWYHVNSLDFVESYTFNSNLIKQLKMKMPKLLSITFVSSFDRSLVTNEDEIMKANLKLICVTTVCFRGTVNERFQQSLIHILPNMKILILPNTYYFIPIVYNKIEKLTIPNVKYFAVWKQSGDIYFPNLKYVDIELDHFETYDLMKILKSFSKCTTLRLHFRFYDPQYGNKGEIDINRMFDKLDLIEILQNYHIKYGYSCVEFTRKIINN